MLIRRNRYARVRMALSVLLTVLVVTGIHWGVVKTQEQATQQAQKMTQESIRRAAVQCYALEGIYPVNIKYLTDRYGIRPDTRRFIVHYQYIADNLLPDIMVLPVVRQGG